MTAQLSQEQREIILKTANHMINRENTSEYSENFRAVAELALRALAGMSSEPVGWEIDYGDDDLPGRFVVTGNKAAAMERKAEGYPVRPLYTAPTAPLAVPSAYWLTEDSTDYHVGWNACCAYMLNHSGDVIEKV